MRYRITESQLESIILSEQKSDIDYNESVQIKVDPKIKGLSFKERETPKSVLEKLQSTNAQFNVFYISSDGYKFPIYPASLKKTFGKGSVKVSKEFLGPMKTAMIHITLPVGK